MRLLILTLAVGCVELPDSEPCADGFDDAAAIEGQRDDGAVDPTSLEVVTACRTFGAPDDADDAAYMGCFERIIQFDGAWCVAHPEGTR